ncbi:unnamed protein product, partial [Tetraodon nigroviridis]
MVIELPMRGMSGLDADKENHSCIVQYILFPPHSASMKDSFSTDDDNDTEVEAVDVDTELNLVTECWVEPQSGFVMNCMEQHRYFQGLKYQEIPQAIFPRDLACMSTMMTFEYLSQLCQNKEQVFPQPGGPKDSRAEAVVSEDGIHMVPFQFDLIQLLPKCQQVELFFPTFSTAVQPEEQLHSSSCLPNELLLNLLHHSLEHELNDREIPLALSDHSAFMHHILERERDGNSAPFALPVIKEECVKPADRQDNMASFHTSCSSKEVMGSTSTLQEDDTLTPSNKSQANSLSGSTSGMERSESGLSLASKLRRSSSSGHFPARSPGLSPQSEGQTGLEDLLVPHQGSWDRGVSETEAGSSQSGPFLLFGIGAQEAPCWEMDQQKFRSRSLDRSSPLPWSDLLPQPHKHKELTSYCSLLEQHYHQSYVKGVYRSLQQSYSISSQDVLMAMDDCEESLQEIDVTSFLNTLCGHMRVFRERGGVGHSPGDYPPTFIIRDGEEGRPEERPAVTSSSRCGSSVGMEDASEAESGKKPFDSGGDEETEASRHFDFPLKLLQTQPKCEVYPDLHRIIQEKFMDVFSQYFKPVPSNPFYYFYCPLSSKKDVSPQLLSVIHKRDPCRQENLSSCGIMTESDADLVVEYEDRQACFPAEAEDRSVSDSNTVNQDQDSFSILDGDSLLEAEGPQLDLPPLFVHVICSVNTKSCHGSMPVQTLPTCLGEVISCLENASALQWVDLNELSVTLDLYVLTLPVEIEVMADFHHNRFKIISLSAIGGFPWYTSESSISLNRSPGQPSSYRSDEELMAVLDSLRGSQGMDGLSSDPLSKLPLPHKLAILATMDEIRWVSGRPDCFSAASLWGHCRGNAAESRRAYRALERSATLCTLKMSRCSLCLGLSNRWKNSKRISLSGYVLNAEQDGFYFLSLSRHHPQRIQASRRLSKPAAALPAVEPCSSVGRPEEAMLEREAAPITPLEADLSTESENRMCAATAAADAPSDTTAETDSQTSFNIDGDQGQAGTPQLLPERCTEALSPPKTPSSVSLAESTHSASHSCGKLRPSRGQSVVSSQGSLDSDMQGYDGGSSDSECESPIMDDQESRLPLMPEFWLIVKIHQDRVKVYSHSRCFTVQDVEKKEDDQELPESLQLHQMVVRKIGEICRIVNQRMLLQDLHDRHVCNSLLVAESEEDIWKTESVYRKRLNTSDDYNTDESYQARDYLAATMQFIPGHFCCDVVWNTMINVHPRLKMGPNMGVSRAIQALRSVLNSFSVVNRKNMFVYQERETKSVFYLRLCETSLTGKYADVDGNVTVARSVGLARSQEPFVPDDLPGSKCSMENSRPVGQVDKHILLLVHGVGSAGPEITDELVKVLRKRLDETTLDIITVMLVRNCKLTPADVDVGGLKHKASYSFIQPSGSPATEVMTFSLPHYCLPWLPAVAHYLRQNLLIFLHVPKYTDSNTAHHFKHHFGLSSDVADGDIYLYNKPGGQGTGGKGIACIVLSFVDPHGCPLQGPAQDDVQRREMCSSPFHPQLFEELTTVSKVNSVNGGSAPEAKLFVRFDIWEQGNVSPLQLSDKLQGALRHALCDVLMELKVLPHPLCVLGMHPATKATKDEAKGLPVSPPAELKEVKDSPRQRSGSRVFKHSPSQISLSQAAGGAPVMGGNTGESTTPTSKSTRRSFWDILSKPETSELVSPKTTDDIVQEKGEEGQRAARRRHKTENVKQQWSQDKAVAVELEQAQRWVTTEAIKVDAFRRPPVAPQERDLSAGGRRRWNSAPNIPAHLPPVDHLHGEARQVLHEGCPSIQRCSADIAAQFLLPCILVEIVNLVSSLASDTTVKAFERRRRPEAAEVFEPLPLGQSSSQPPDTSRSFILIGRNFHQWHCSTEQEERSDEENSPVLNRFTPHKGFQRFDALEASEWNASGRTRAGLAPRQRFLYISIQEKKVTLYSYNWSVDLGAALNRDLVRLVKWQNARAHVVHCLLNQKMGLFHHHCFSDAPIHEMESKQVKKQLTDTEAVDLVRWLCAQGSKTEIPQASASGCTQADRGERGSERDSNPFLCASVEPDTLLRSGVPPLPSKEQGRLGGPGRSLAPLHFPSELLPFDEALRDVCTIRPLMEGDVVARHGGQLLEIKAAERRELEKQMKIENLFVTWQQRSAQSNMPISVSDK